MKKTITWGFPLAILILLPFFWSCSHSKKSPVTNNSSPIESNAFASSDDIKEIDSQKIKKKSKKSKKNGNKKYKNKS